MQDELMESIEPYDFNEAVDFNVAYLAGYAADRYDISKDETFGRATTRFREGTEAAFRRDIHGYDTVEVKESTLQFSNTEAKYALYPVWLLRTLWKDKNFYFAVNGQTGKIAGNLPVSPLKFTLFFLIFFLLFGGAAFGLVFALAGDIAMASLIGVIFGLVVALAITLGMRKKMKNVRFQYGAYNYEKANSLHIDYKRDIFMYRKVYRTKRSTSTNRR